MKEARFAEDQSESQPGISKMPSIVLVRPTGARNIGSIARVMSNFGFSDLRLVDPQCDHLSLESRKMAMRACTVLESARVFSHCAEAVSEARYVVATTARARNANRQLEGLESALSPSIKWLNESAIFFGTEEAGLPNEALDLAHSWMTFPTVPSSRSLNLAQSVGIACYEFHRMISQSSLAKEFLEKFEQRLPSKERPMKLDDLQHLFGQAEQFFTSIDFIQPHTREVRMRRIVHILQRSGLSESDGRFLSALFYFIGNRLK